MGTPHFSAAPRLKSLELQGYKTFASKTVFAFSPTTTVIVGPNGAGKSNIADAIRWVLGEQSFGLLRAKRTEDLIFSGSELRPRAGMASAIITFDNSEGWLPIEFSEVTVGRRAYRDGQNEYLINGQRVRLRDVSELLAKCGLSQRTYSVIGQGLVDAALSLKAEERRKLFEEAAGISLYRSRREEALRRLESTRRNLERVQDILEELRPRLGQLERQAQRAQLYNQVRRDLTEALRLWYGYHWGHSEEVVRKQLERVEAQRLERDGMRRRQHGIEGELSTIRGEIDELRRAVHAVLQELSAVYDQREQHGRHLAVTEERLRWLREQESVMQEEIASLREQQQGLSRMLGQAGQSLQGSEKGGAAPVEGSHEVKREDLAGLLGRARELQVTLENAVRGRTANEALLRQQRERLGEVVSRKDRLEAAVADACSEVEAATAQIGTAQQTLEKASALRAGAEASQREVGDELEVGEAELGRQQQVLARLQARRSKLEAEKAAVQQLAHGLRLSAQAMIRASKRGKLKGVMGNLSGGVTIAEEYRVAIHEALGDFVYGLAFRSADDVSAAVEWLKAQASGKRAALAPLAPRRSSPRLKAPKDPGCLGNAASLVVSEAPYQKLVDLLLGRTLIVQDRAAATRLVGDLPPDGRIVTIAGEVFHASGLVTVGAGAGDWDEKKLKDEHKVTMSALAATEKSCADLHLRVQSLKRRLEAARLAFAQSLEAESEARSSLASREMAAEAAKGKHELVSSQLADLTEETGRLEEQLNALVESESKLAEEADRARQELLRIQEQVSLAGGDPLVIEAQAQLTAVHLAVEDARNRVVEFQGVQADTLQSDLQDWQGRLAGNLEEQEALRSALAEAQAQAAATESRLEQLNGHLAQVEQNLTELEGKRSSLEAQDGQARGLLQASERQLSQLQIDLARREEEMASLRRRIEDDFGLVVYNDGSALMPQEPLPLEGVVERLQRVEELPLDFENQVANLRNQLRRIGPVNLEAQREFREVQRRVRFLTTQTEDLHRAEAQIQEVISELDMLMDQEFRKTFESVATGFRDTFRHLFGGGSARLVLGEESDHQEAGIDIEARLPGRREQGLALLSGGERSLVASALIFALLRSSPPPFCVLDEVDAMLDESNVVRFASMLRELSRQTQFIVITHNRHTVQEAEVVYGVSMGPDSASKTISLKLDGVEQPASSPG